MAVEPRQLPGALDRNDTKKGDARDASLPRGQSTLCLAMGALVHSNHSTQSKVIYISTHIFIVR